MPLGLAPMVTRQVTQKLQGLHRAHSNATILRSEQFIVDNGGNALGSAVSLLSECIAQKKLVSIEYHSKDGLDSVRVVEPYCLILKDGMWYVYSFCRLRRGFRYFKVSRIVKMEVGEKFAGRQFQANSDVIHTDVLKGKEMCEVILTVENSSLSACEEWLGANNVAKVGETHVARATLPYDEILINQILSLGDGVRVEKPQRLREAVIERCQSIARINKAE